MTRIASEDPGSGSIEPAIIESDELIRQLRQLRGVVAVRVDGELDRVRVALDPTSSESVSPAQVQETIERLVPTPCIIEIAVRAG